MTYIAEKPWWRYSHQFWVVVCRTRSYTLTLFKVEIKIHTAISRKVVGKNVHVTIPKDNMGYVQYTVPDTGVLLLSFSTRRFMSTASPSILSNSLKNSELKTTHNTFRGCRVPFLEIAVYSYFEKGCRKKCAHDNPER